MITIKNINTRIQNKHDIENNWLKAINFIPKDGEIIIYDIDENYTYPRLKIGNGIDTINTLPFMNKIDSTLTMSNQAADAKAVGEAISSIPPAIIDVVELPTEDIREDCFYRLLSGSFVYNQYVQNGWTCHSVESLPESGEPVTSDMASIIAYYDTSTNDVYGYINDILASQAGVPTGWYTLATLAPVFDVNWSGIITDILNDPRDSSFRLLLEYVNYSYKNGKWTSDKKIGWAGDGSGAEVFNHPSNKAYGSVSHAEGRFTVAGIEGVKSYGAHAEGYETQALAEASHAEGIHTIAEGDDSHAEGNASHAKGYHSHAEGDASHAEGACSHAEGYYSHAEGYYSHAEGSQSHAEGNASHAEGICSHAEGYHSHAKGYHSHAEGYCSHAEGYCSHAEGYGNTWSYAISGDANTTVYAIDKVSNLIIGAYVHYTINNNGVLTNYSAKITKIDVINKTVTVNRTLSADVALSNASVIIYVSGMALGGYSHSEGNQTIAAGRSQHTQGEYNIVDPEYNVNKPSDRAKYVHIVGNGTSHTSRSNAHTLDWSGNAWFQGEVYVGGSGQDDENAVKLAKMSDIPSTEGLATESYVNTTIANLVNSAPDALNTLDELAAALGDDENFANTVTNQIATKQDAITGTAGQFVVIGNDGKPTTKTILIAEEATF